MTIDISPWVIGIIFLCGIICGFLLNKPHDRRWM